MDVAIQAALKEKKLWLTSETASFFAEDIPAGVLSDNAYLQAPPQPVPVKDILPTYGDALAIEMAGMAFGKPSTLTAWSMAWSFAASLI